MQTNTAKHLLNLNLLSAADFVACQSAATSGGKSAAVGQQCDDDSTFLTSIMYRCEMRSIILSPGKAASWWSVLCESKLMIGVGIIYLFLLGLSVLQSVTLVKCRYTQLGYGLEHIR